MDDPYPSVFHTNLTEIDDPDIRSTGRYEQARQTLRIGKMRFVQMEAAALLIREKRLNPKTFGIHMTGFFR